MNIEVRASETGGDESVSPVAREDAHKAARSQVHTFGEMWRDTPLVGRAEGFPLGAVETK